MMKEAAMMRMRDELAEKAAVCKVQEAALSADGRVDESVHVRIERNVYEAFSAVLNAACRQADPAEFFHTRLIQIPANWAAAKETALAHSDGEKAYIETIKLKAAADIKAAFCRIMEDA